MKKKVIISIAVLLLVIGFIFYKIQDNFMFDELSLVTCIPENTEILIQIHHPEQYGNFINSISFYKELNAFQSFIPFKELTCFIDSSVIAKSNIGEKLKKRPLLISLHRDENNNLCWLFAVSLKTKQEEREVLKIINEIWGETYRDKKFGETIFTLTENEYVPVEIYASCSKGILSASNSFSRLNESLKQRNSGKSLLDNNSFSKIYKNKPNSDIASVYLNFNEIGELLSPLFSSEGKDVVDAFADFGEWAGLDLDVKDALTLNGFITGNHNKLFASIFDGINIQKPEIYNIIPQETKFIMNYSFASNDMFKDNYASYIKQKGNDYQKLAELFENDHGISFENMLFSFIKNEAALVYTKDKKESDPFKFLVINTAGQSKTLETINKYIHRSGDDILASDFIILDDRSKTPVYEGFSVPMMKAFWKNLFPNVPCNVFSFYKNYIVFSEDKESLESFIYSALLNKNFASYSYFSAFIENFALNENFFMFVDVPYIFSFAKEYLSSEVFYPTYEQEDALNNFYGLGVQISSSGKYVYSTIALNHVPHRDDEPHTIWQSRLDSTILKKPILVDNHNTGEKEILVQDALNNLYLINNMGRILWKKPLEGAVISDFFQIDYYKNGKLQYLFNTENRIYLIDRNGNHVGNYPIILPEKATNGLSVYDYDKNKDYRIFIAFSDNKVYLFEKTWNSKPEWTTPQTEG
jgi:hypothetical protein